ncbi:MAG TPA: sigma-70 family RNA polymerase sigma factor [Caulobacteraceae bacterium]|jgi:RNA polymerase sigma-70 factor (ECF subfamily)
MTEFQVLYERYAPDVRRFALYLSGDPAIADDITSETFVRAWTAPGPLRAETVKAYLFTIARNLYRDTLRRARRHAVLDESIPDESASAESRAEDRSQLGLVMAEIQKLTEIDRAALLMRAQEQMSYQEIARALGLTVAVIKVRIHRARLKLVRSTRLVDARRSGLETP